MACECQEPCEPQPYRCSCERDCWIGLPGDYATCIQDCEIDGCEFPEYPGLPSRGYRCDVPPDTDQVDCEDVCSAAYTTANTDCFDTYSSCEGEGCLGSYCACQTSAQQDYETCKLDCDADHDYLDAIVCAETDVADSNTCCDVALSTCYLPCEQAFLTAAEAVELNYLTCVRAKNASYLGFWVEEEEVGDCLAGGAPNLMSCEQARTLAMAPLLRTREICRATCERNEIRRETPADRKYKECGGRYHLCKSTCDAEFDYDMAVAAYNSYPCIEACVVADLSEEAEFECLVPCYSAYRQAFAEAAEDQARCRLDCCKQEYEHARNGHAKTECELDCYGPRILGTINCYDAYQQCFTEDIADGGDGSSCQSAWCTCFDGVVAEYEACRGSCISIRNDCPDCFDDAIEDLGGMSGEGYGSSAPGMPPVGIGPDYEPQGCP